MKNKILVPLANGFEEIEAVTIIDILRRGEMDVVTASLNDNLFVIGAHNITIQADKYLKNLDIEMLDMIILPGGWEGTKTLANNEIIQNILKGMDKNNKLIGAICAAPYVLDKAGVLKNKFTCYPSVEKEITSCGYIKDGENIIWDENILTSKGPATAMLFALEILKKLQTKEIYESVKKALLFSL